MVLPAAFQVPGFGADIGGVNPAFFAFNADAEYDSWLTVGPTDGVEAGPPAGGNERLATIPGCIEAEDLVRCMGLSEWTAEAAFSCSDCAMFWVDPDDGPSGDVVVAQITVAAGSSGRVSMGLQGRSVDGADWTGAARFDW